MAGTFKQGGDSRCPRRVPGEPAQTQPEVTIQGARKSAKTSSRNNASAQLGNVLQRNHATRSKSGPWAPWRPEASIPAQGDIHVKAEPLLERMKTIPNHFGSLECETGLG